MNFQYRHLVVTSVILAGMAHRATADDAAAEKRIELARTLVKHLVDGEFDRAVVPFDDVMKKGLPAETLGAVWSKVTRELGEFRQADKTRTQEVKEYHIVFVTCDFEKGPIDTKVVFTDDAKVAGLFFVPTERYETPAYVDASAFDEVDIKVGDGLWQLPGTLSLPHGEGPFPAVVLVHGSGPNDRDETIGPNKPFRDIAHGMASRGIAVLRYEKRTKHHQVKMALLSATLTVQEETIDDAAAAVEVLAANDNIDSKRIYVLGHSLGGYVLPRIAQASERAAGFISLAGSTRPLEVLIVEQVAYIAGLDGEITEDEQQQIDEINAQAARVASPDFSKETKGKLPLGIPKAYWLDLREYRATEMVRDVDRPMLFLQGARDYQVTMDDFAGWKKALASRNDVTFIGYPELNHLFVAGEGKSGPTEYLAPGNVAEQVIDDVAGWIKSLAP